MGQQKHILDRIAVSADLSTEPMPMQSLVEIINDRRIIIENHSGIMKYSPQEICIKVRFGQVLISGSFLEIARMTKEQLVILGVIEGVKLCKGGN